MIKFGKIVKFEKIIKFDKIVKFDRIVKYADYTTVQMVKFEKKCSNST